MQHFETIEELRQALLVFRETYNTTWMIERHGFVRSSFNPSPGARGLQYGVTETEAGHETQLCATQAGWPERRR